MTKNQIQDILDDHRRWIADNAGKRANLCSADLHGANLCAADLCDADLRGADLCDADLRGADLHGANLCSADLCDANLCAANLRGADLHDANLDFNCWPLWCGSLDVIVDKRIACQLAYHFCRLDCDDPGYIAARNAIIDFANQFHRVGECGLLTKTEVGDNDD